MTEPQGSSDSEQTTALFTDDLFTFRDPAAIGVSFRRNGKIYYFAPNGLSVRQGDMVLAQTEKGVDIGEVVFVKYDLPEGDEHRQLKPLVRKATAEDLAQEGDLQLKEREARKVCEQKILEHHLPMRLIAADYTFDSSRLVFFFSAEGRVDFRALVKDLAEIFRTRIELRQIGVRDQAKMIGGLGPCGRPLCCNAWLRNFDPVGIRVAKDQGLSLNPAKISGICDRLMCCLRYEHGTYQELSRKLPKVGEIVSTRKGPAVVKRVVLMHERVGVEYPGGALEELTGDEVWPADVVPPEAPVKPVVEEAETPVVDEWDTPLSIVPEKGKSAEEGGEAGRSSRRRRRRKPGKGKAEGEAPSMAASTAPAASPAPAAATEDRPARPPRPPRNRAANKPPAPPETPRPSPAPAAPAAEGGGGEEGARRRRRRPRYRPRGGGGSKPEQGQ